MLEIIKKLFKETYFEVIEIEPDFKSKEEYFKHQSFFARISNNTKFDFFLVLEIKEAEIIQESLTAMIDEYFEYITQGKYEYGIDKNLSLIILIEEDSVKLDKNIKTFVYDLEEDPYDFKKNVILYKTVQKEILQEKLIADRAYGEQLQNILQNKELFTWFKHHQHLQNKDNKTLLYDIVSKIFVKLHFFTIQINALNLSNLNQEIEAGLSPSQLQLRNKIIAYNLSEETDVEILIEKLGEEIDGE